MVMSLVVGGSGKICGVDRGDDGNCLLPIIDGSGGDTDDDCCQLVHSVFFVLHFLFSGKEYGVSGGVQ